jgi:serine/threonine-protein kinase
MVGIGTQIGDLRVIRELGSGGMGSVFLAEHQLLNTLLAIKILNPALAHNEEIVTRFLNEARATVKLRHPCLVTVHDIGRLPDRGPYYMVMEYLEGMSLGAFLAHQRGPHSIHVTLELLVDVLNCLKYMHDRGVVHRDLKPDNLFITRNSEDASIVKVLDLGVALVSDAIAIGPGTRAGTILGTPVYMAPEQLAGTKVTPKADLFAIAMIAYEMLTGGWFPWQQDHETRDDYVNFREGELYFRQRTAPPTDPRRRCPGISEGVARVLLRTLDADPERRPEDAAELAWLFAEQAQANDTHESGFAIVAKRAKKLLEGRSPEASAERRSHGHAASPSSKLRYQLGRKIGIGGMAEVFEGTLLGVEGFERRVAIKRVRSGLSEVPGFVDMFVSEARIASRLVHTNVVGVFAFDRDEDGLYLVMEYVHGKDLAALRAAGPIPPSLAIYIVVETLRGLGYAHAPEPEREGVIHRDMSPQNLLLSYEGEVKVVDFGLAKVRSASGTAQSEHVRGKPSYMSPEQCNGEPIDARSDLFAVGVMLHEMLTDQPLFTGTTNEIIARVLFQKIPLPSSMRSRIPMDLERITMKLLERKADDRYPTAEAAIEDLLQCADAPRDGRGELVHILAQRFPEAALRTRFGVSGSAPGSKPSFGRPLYAEQMAVPDQMTVTAPGPVSTLASAASQSSPVVAVRSRRWTHVLGLGAGVVVLMSALVAMGLLVRGAHAPAATPDDEAALGGGGRSRDVAAASAARHEPVATPAVSATGAVSSAAPQPSHDVEPKAPAVAGATGHAAERPNASAPASSAPMPTTTATAATAPETASRAPAPAAASPKGIGELAIIVRPWASITLNGKDGGMTPFRQNVPAGRYRIRLFNEDIGKSDIVLVTVEPNKTTTVERKW